MSDDEKKEEKTEEETEEVEEDVTVESKADEEEKVEEKKEEKTEEPKKKEKEAPSGKYADLIKQIESLSVLELSDLVKELEDRFGVSAAMPMAVGAAPAAGAAAGGEVEEEKTNFTVVLSASGDQKIAVIKAVREIRQDLGLKEAKDLVDGAPKEVLANAKKADAEEAKKKLEAAGATVELK